MSKTIKVKLSKPYTLAGVSLEEITFREPKLSDLIIVEDVVKGGQHAMTACMMAQLSGATQPELCEFTFADYAVCDRALRPFMSTVDTAGDD